MLRTRVLSAAILVPVVAALAFLGGVWFALLVIVIAGLAGWEYFQLLRYGGYQTCRVLGLGWILTCLVAAWRPDWIPLAPALAGATLVTLIWAMSRGGTSVPAAEWALTLAGGLYLGWLPGHFIILRAAPQGLQWLVLALGGTWITDSLAYFVGTAWGRHPLWPRLSPKKTWEGAIGGWVGGVPLIVALAALLGFDWRHGLAVGILICTIAPLGDFAESMFKRQVGVKDSGHLIPGHGGMLDRVDSLLFVAPAVYYYSTWIG